MSEVMELTGESMQDPFECPVVSRVVRLDICMGCGVCAAACPRDSLVMKLNESGEYVPFLEGKCLDCGVCCKVCPQLRGSEMWPSHGELATVAPHSVLGRGQELSTWAGYAVDPDRRCQSASGGMLTIVLQHLMWTQQIDKAVVVGPSLGHKAPLFEMRTIQSLQGLSNCAGSKYYPVHLADPLKEALSSEEQVAFVGLPCHIRGVKCLINEMPSLREKIRFLFGLTCGHGVSTFFTEVLAAAARISLNEVDTVSYREKQTVGHANNFMFQGVKSGHKTGSALCFQTSIYGDAWLSRFFVPRACEFCHDCFAEGADATFMDGWLDKYINDPKGTSLIVSRCTAVREILDTLQTLSLARTWRVPATDVIRSQKAVIHYKRELLPSRVQASLGRGEAVPEGLRAIARQGTNLQRMENTLYRARTAVSAFIWELDLPQTMKLIMLKLAAVRPLRTARSLMSRLLPICFKNGI